MLEDLGSSNGTYLGDGRVTGPVPLQANARFSIGVFTYEVASMDPAGDSGDALDDEAASEFLAADPNMETRAAKAIKSPPAKERSASARKAAPEAPAARPATKVPPEETGAEDAPPQAPSAKRGAEQPNTPAAPHAAELAGDPKSVKFYLAALPRSVAYHLANVPLLVLNPPGTVRKSIEQMPLPELAWPGLIVYALPATLFSAAVTFLCTLVVQLVTGTLSLGGIIPVVPLAVAVAGSVLGGLACHPLLTWVVGKLKGQSTARQRTNYFVLSMSAVVVTSIPSGLAILLASVRLPFIGVLPVLLSLVGTALTVFISYRWFTAFNVVKWFRIVLLVLGGLAALGAARSLVEVVIAGVKSLGASSPSSGGEPSAAPAGDTAKPADATAPAASDPKAEAAAEEPKAAKEEDPETARKGKNAKKGKAARAEDKEEKDSAPAAGGVDYGTYLEHRDAMEKAIERNPRLLKTVPGLLAQYEKYHRTVFDIRNRREAGGKKKAAPPDPALEPVRQRLKDIEVYERTQAMVEDLLRKVQ